MNLFLRCFLTAVSAVLLIYWFVLSADYFVDRRGGVKVLFLFDWRLIVGEWWFIRGEAWSKRVDNVRDIENWFQIVR